MHRAPTLPAAVLLAAFLVSCGDGGTDPASEGIGDLQKHSGDEQEAVVGHELPAPIGVRVVDRLGRPVPDEVVTFRVVSGGGTLFAGSSTTNGEGIARERWTLGTSTADSQKVEVRVVDNTDDSSFLTAVFVATPLPDAPAQASELDGDAQSGSLGAALADSLSVRVVDRHGNPVPAVPVTWSVASGGGSIAPDATSTDSSGVARARWTVGTRLDQPQRATATAGDLPAITFDATASWPAGSALARLAGDAQTDTIGATLRNRLVVRAQLADGRPIAGAPVTWSVAQGGGTVAPQSAVTDADGRAEAAWTLGVSSGESTVSVAAEGVAPAVFRATVRPGAPAGLTATSGNGQEGPVGEPLDRQLAVRVTDQRGNAVPGATVRWTVTAGGGSAAAESTSDDGAIARVTWSLGTVAGADQELAATLPGGEPVVFRATARAGAPARVERVQGEGQAATVGYALADSLAVRVYDRYDNRVPGAGVTWSSASWRGSLSPAASATDGAGRAAAKWTLGLDPGSQSVTVTVAPAAPIAFSATANAGERIDRWIHELSFPAEELWGTSATDVFVVGDGGRIVHYDGTGWTEMASGATATLRGIWGSSPSNVFAVGAAGTILRYDGRVWQSMTSPVADSLYAVWGSSANDVYAVGGTGRGIVLHFDGSEWRTVFQDSVPAYRGVGGRSAGDVWVVGPSYVRRGNRFAHFDGLAWSTVPIEINAYTSSFNSVWVDDTGSLFVPGMGEYADNTMGWYAKVYRHDGTSWTTFTAVFGVRPWEFFDIWGAPATGIYYAATSEGVARRSSTGQWTLMVDEYHLPLRNVKRLWGWSPTGALAVTRGGIYRGQP